MSVVLITGASTGIGQNLTYSLAHKGHKVYAGVRSEEDFSNLKNENHERIIPLFLDVTKEHEIKMALDQIHQGGDSVEILINNAGMVIATPLESLSLDRMQQQMDVNFFGPFRLIKICLPDLKKNRGRIINIGSTSGLVAWPFSSAYTASKFALDGWSQSLRVELACVGIKVVTVAPGAVKTPIWKKATDDFDQIVAEHPEYQRGLLATRKLIDKGVQRAVHPMAVTMKIVAAIRDPNPKELYLVGPNAYTQYYLSRLLPRNFFSWLKTRLCSCVSKSTANT